MRSLNTSLDAHLEGRVVVRLPNGKQERMSRRKAYIYKLAVASANGQWAALTLLLKIAERATNEENASF